MPTPTYGTYNPSGVDPYPIESTLAGIVGANNPGAAANMLDLYQIKNQTTGDNYAYELAQQHQFAKQQLAQALYEKNLSALTEAPKTAGTLSLLASSPQFSGVTSGIDPRVLGGIEQGLTNLQRAKTFQEAGSGLASTTAAGFQPSTEQAAAVTGGVSGPQGDPTTVAAAKINAAGRIAASGSRPQGIGISIPLAPQAILGGAAPSASIPKGMGAEQAATQLRNMGYDIPVPVAPPTTGGTSTALTKSSGQTNLPKAKADTPVSHTTEGGGDIHAQAEAFVENVIRPQLPAVYKDIQAGKVGGKINVVIGPDGQAHIKGKERLY